MDKRSSLKETRERRANIVADIVKKAGGTVDGRTKLQKIIYILTEASFVSEFQYEYRHYGPYSEELAEVPSYAGSFVVLNEEEKYTSWGASYFSYTTTQDKNEAETEEVALIRAANKAPSIILELAATALFLKDNPDPWGETRKRKPDKAENGRLQQACALYQELKAIASQLPFLPEHTVS